MELKKSEFYKNRFPLEDLIPVIDEAEVQDIVVNCDYTFEANRICDADKSDNKVNTADAAVFFQMGYEYYIKILSEKLTPYQP